MCGRYALSFDSDELPVAFGQWGIDINLRGNNVNYKDSDNIGDSENDTSTSVNSNMLHYDKSFNVAPTSRAPVLNSKNDDVRYMRWGLIPHWSKKIGTFKGYTTFNARMENLLSSKIWHGCLGCRRCVVPISGYYEWLVKSHDKSKTPYYLRRKDHKILFLAGLFDYNETEQMFSYTIITGPAPEGLKWLHDRMPCVLEYDSDEWKQWMNPDKLKWNQKELDNVLTPSFDDHLYRVYQVTRDAGKVSNKGQYLTKPILKEDSDRIKKEEGSISIKKQDEEDSKLGLMSVKEETPMEKTELKMALKRELSDDLKPKKPKRRNIMDMIRQSSNQKGRKSRETDVKRETPS
ncbi:similar to Saccharomyces cerevisiae YMR114C Protein of unknown function [Maudiozyma barnettii]|uniref:DUF159 domain protein n=1 Tax=Maudiozyma barnettii TaxID=61262 RepID=A0A8H2VF73_9SACH|nr:putative peptide hydrolase [Kazachstania barnettii]CAB4254450.1 similar to Saccharomyces cerevisiae YMR114C Protein of unknown function [Kazachstania barnettii]CAD1782411.1 similar to Saccharomyces cerevisiae YMR114C Protein of unknown function [Kazachstania barnettii]